MSEVYCNTDLYRFHRISGTGLLPVYTNALHYDTSLTLSWFKKGNALIRVEGNMYKLNDGDAILMNRNELHHSEVDGNVYCDRLTVYIDEKIVSALPYNISALLDGFLNRKRGTLNKIDAEVFILKNLDKDMEYLCELSKAETDINKALSVCRIVEMLSKINSVILPLKLNTLEVSSDNSTVDKILKYINENYTKNIDCDDISKHFHINKYYMERLFKKSVGMSLWDYIINRRLLYCNDLIRQGQSIKEASFSSGFANYSNFYKLYKKHMKIIPSEFKNQTK